MLTIGAGAALLAPGGMRAAEDAAIAAGTPALLLMERAAAAAVRAVLMFAPGKAVLVLCGQGNNGGDGYGVAIGLRAAGVAVRLAATGPAADEPAATMAARWAGPVECIANAAAAPVIVDALFGTGLRRPLPEREQAAIDRLRGQGLVVAIDIASGIDATTGAALGRPLKADMTVTFAARKLGHVIGNGPELSGRIVVADIGVALPEGGVRLVPAPFVGAMPAGTHKYNRGAILVVEGAARRGGAAQLTALAALRAGAGVVTLVGDGDDAPATAIMRRSDDEGRAMLGDLRLGAIAIGPGLVDDARGQDWLALVLARTVPVVADAGALAMMPGFGMAPLVLTPHEGEFTRLFGDIGGDRVGAVQAAAASSGAVVVLKGAATIIAAPGGRTAINAHAAPWLATAGSGDVLTGIIAALLAQGLTPFDAARAGVWLHGDAGLRGGPGLIADDISGLLPAVFAGLEMAQ